MVIREDAIGQESERNAADGVNAVGAGVFKGEFQLEGGGDAEGRGFGAFAGAVDGGDFVEITGRAVGGGEVGVGGVGDGSDVGGICRCCWWSDRHCKSGRRWRDSSLGPIWLRRPARNRRGRWARAAGRQESR